MLHQLSNGIVIFYLLVCIVHMTEQLYPSYISASLSLSLALPHSPTYVLFHLFCIRCDCGENAFPFRIGLYRCMYHRWHSQNVKNSKHIRPIPSHFEFVKLHAFIIIVPLDRVCSIDIDTSVSRQLSRINTFHFISIRLLLCTMYGHIFK